MTTRLVVLLALLWCSGVGLRSTILAVPPVLPQIQSDLQLSGTQVGLLSGLPVVFFAVAALPGSLLIARMGATRTLLFGLLLTAVAASLRGVIPHVVPLFLATALMGAGIAIAQPSAPALVRSWMPDKIGLGTAVYTNGLFIGATIPVALTLPLVLPLLGGSWRLELAFWAFGPLVAALLLLLFAPGGKQETRPAIPVAWWPDWRSGLIWKLGVIFAGVNSPFFGTNAFLPAYLNEIGRSDLISAALTALNTCQLPASILLIVFAKRLQGRRWPLAAAALLVIVGLTGIASTASGWTAIWAGVCGFASGACLALGLSLPPLLSAPEDVPRVSAAMFTISYASAMAISVLGGIAWDASGTVRSAFVPIALSALTIVALMPTIRFPGRQP